MRLIDTHCHLDAAELRENLDLRIAAARAAGVDGFVVPAVCAANFQHVADLCARYPGCFPAYGIHPMYTGEATEDDLAVLRGRIVHSDPVAIGEIGLDFFVEPCDRDRQLHFFSEQLKLAREFDLPVLIHSRRALDAVLMQLRRLPVRGGIAHAFNGSLQQAQELIKMGFRLGFGGAATHPRATRLQALAKTLPLSCIALETDAPDMRPEFVERGLPNSPEYLPKIAAFLAGLRGMPADQFAQATTDNALGVLPGVSCACAGMTGPL